MITTVLTLMGVFSAIITIIMSVVITSSSWLNNANGASAILAFVIPNFVVVSSIIVLMEVVFDKKKPEIIVVSGKDWRQPDIADKALKKAKAEHIVTIAIVFIFTAIITGFSLHNMMTSSEPHMRYVLSQGMYECVETQSDEDSTPEISIVFQVNERNYIFSYNEDYFHDGKLYFCEEHQQLE